MSKHATSGGHRVRKHLVWSARVLAAPRAQRRFPFLAPEHIEHRQRQRVRAAVTHAYEHVPYYREAMRRLGLRPTDFARADDLAKLPLIDREDLRRDPEYFVSRAQPIERYVALRTSGTTGQPMIVFRDRATIFQRAIHAGRLDAVVRGLVGRRPIYRRATIMVPGAAFSAGSQAFARLRLAPPPLRRRRVVLSAFASFEENSAALKAFQPQVIEGYGSYLEALFAHLDTDGPATGRAEGRPLRR